MYLIDKLFKRIFLNQNFQKISNSSVLSIYLSIPPWSPGNLALARVAALALCAHTSSAVATNNNLRQQMCF